MRLVGIDYSMNCPCITLFGGDKFAFDKCQVHFLIDKKSLHDTFGNIKGHPYPDGWNENAERFDYISSWAYDIISEFNPDVIAMEGYSMNSQIGRAFDIAENTAFLKLKLILGHRKGEIKKPLPLLYPPTTVKKFAVGKGNSPKDPIVQKFYEESNINLHDILGIKSKKMDINPISDIADSYFITKLLFEDANFLIL